MRYAFAVIVALSSSAALAQATPAYQTGFQGMGTSSNYPSNPCAQCGGSRLYAVQAEPGDVHVGYRVLSTYGSVIGEVVAADDTQAVVRTPAMLVRVPKAAFGKARNGLVLDVSRARLEAMAREAQR